MECRKRQHAFITQALRAVPAKAAHAGEFRSTETWQDFTESDVAKRDRRDENDEDAA